MYQIVNCSECGEEYNIKRAKLGFSTCLDCGDKEANRISKFRSRCCVPLYNKGPVQPIMTLSDARWAGR